MTNHLHRNQQYLQPVGGSASHGQQAPVMANNTSNSWMNEQLMSQGGDSYIGFIEGCEGRGLGFEAGYQFTNEQPGVQDYGVKYDNRLLNAEVRAGEFCEPGESPTFGASASFDAIQLGMGYQGEGAAFGGHVGFGSLEATTEGLMPHASATLFEAGVTANTLNPASSVDWNAGVEVGLGVSSPLPMVMPSTSDQDFDGHPEYGLAVETPVADFSYATEDPARLLLTPGSIPNDINVTQTIGRLWNQYNGNGQ